MRVTRSRPALHPPVEGAHDFTKFPRKTHRASTKWYRQHNDRPADSDRGAWYFASHPVGDVSGGRFDLAEPGGTCYLATSERGAAFECIGPEYADLGWVDAGLVEGRVLSSLLLSHDVKAADATATRASDFRVTNELQTGNDYATTQAWAQLLHGVGYGGLHYGLRFSPGSARGLALFGAAGVPAPKPAGDPNPVDLREFVERLGIEVVEVPTMPAVRIVTPEEALHR